MVTPLKIEARLPAHRGHPGTPVRIQKFPHTPFTMMPFQIDFHAREHPRLRGQGPQKRALAYSNPFTRRSLKSGRRETLELDIPKRLNGVTAGYLKLGLPHRKDNKVTSSRLAISERKEPPGRLLQEYSGSRTWRLCAFRQRRDLDVRRSTVVSAAPEPEAKNERRRGVATLLRGGETQDQPHNRHVPTNMWGMTLHVEGLRWHDPISATAF